MPGTTPVYGFPYPEPTDLVADYPALGQQLAEDIEAVLPDLGGLAPVAPTSIANSGGSASTTGNTTTFTGVSSISLNGVFSADYDNYRIMVTCASSTAMDIHMRLRAAGSDNTTSNYDNAVWRFSSTGTTGSVFTGTTTLWQVSKNDGAYGHAFLPLDIMSPFAARITRMTGVTNGAISGISATTAMLGVNTFLATTSFDGITIYPSTGNISGIVSIYGYRK